MHISLFPAICNLIKQANSTLLDETYSLNKAAAQPTLSRDYGAAKRRYDNYVAQGAYDLPPGQKDPAALNARNEYKLLEGMHRQTNPQPYNPNVVANRGINSASYADTGVSYGDMLGDQFKRIANRYGGDYQLSYANNPLLDWGSYALEAAPSLFLAAGTGGTSMAAQGGSRAGILGTRVAAPALRYVSSTGKQLFPFIRSQAIPFYNTGQTLLTNPSSFKFFPNVRNLWNIGRMRAGQGAALNQAANAFGHTLSSGYGLYNIGRAGFEGYDRAVDTGNNSLGAQHGLKHYLGGIFVNPAGPLTVGLSDYASSQLDPGVMKTIVGLPANLNLNPIRPSTSLDVLNSDRLQAYNDGLAENITESPSTILPQSLHAVEQSLIAKGYSPDAAKRQAQFSILLGAENNPNAFAPDLIDSLKLRMYSGHDNLSNDHVRELLSAINANTYSTPQSQ